MSRMLMQTDTCVCAPGDNRGVRPVHVVAKENLELWGACRSNPSPYEFGCNHLLLPKGESVTIPSAPLLVYESSEGPHFHVRARRNDPHKLSSHDWEEIKLSTCSCLGSGFD